MSCSASGDSRYWAIGHLLQNCSWRLAARRPSLPMKSASCCSPSSVVRSPRSSEANASDARLRSALNFLVLLRLLLKETESSRITSLAFVLPRRNQAFHEMVVVIGEIDVAHGHDRHSAFLTTVHELAKFVKALRVASTLSRRHEAEFATTQSLTAYGAAMWCRAGVREGAASMVHVHRHDRTTLS